MTPKQIALVQDSFAKVALISARNVMKDTECSCDDELESNSPA